MHTTDEHIHWNEMVTGIGKQADEFADGHLLAQFWRDGQGVYVCLYVHVSRGVKLDNRFISCWNQSTMGQDDIVL